MKLRPYQQEVARAVMDSILRRKGLTFSVEIARQGGKNELSAHLEVLLLTLYMARGGKLIKCSPTFKPQSIISMQRLKERLDEFGFDGIYNNQMGYIIQIGNAQVIFLSAEGSSSVVGHTADILMEVDEAQDVSKEKYGKEFRPMGSATNVTTVIYGTTWDNSTLLEEVKQNNIELEKEDGVRRHFRYDWQEIGKYNPDYVKFVQAERQRLGEDHPLFRTQYALLPIVGGGALLSRQQVALMLGGHPRQSLPESGKTYIAGVDLAGGREQDMLLTGEPSLLSLRGASATKQSPDDERSLNFAYNCGTENQDSTVISIAEVDVAKPSLPLLKVVEQYRWTGTPHSQLYPQMVTIFRNVWNCHRIVVDATGIGQPVASFLRKELGSKVVPFTFSSRSKSNVGFELLSFVDSGRLQIYRQDGSREYKQTMLELEKARAQYRPNQTMNFYVDPQEGHDDFLISLALLVQAAKGFSRRGARGWVRNE